MNKGIVMEMSESSIIVMSPDGRFEKLPRGTRNCEVGEEIIYAPGKPRLKVPQMAVASGLIAAVVLCFVLVSTLGGTITNGQVVAYVSIDINPSVELGIDSEEIVQELNGLNADGMSLVESLDYEGKTLEDVTTAILDKAEQGPLASGEGDIIISSTVVGEQADIDDEAIAAKLKEQVNEHIQEVHPEQASNYEVTAFAAPQEVRQEAKESGVSAGKYAIYLNAVDNGVDVSLDDIKSESIHQLAKEKGGIKSLVNPDKPINKTALKKLIEDQKSGKLSEKLKQAGKKSTSTPASSGSSNSKNSQNGSGNKEDTKKAPGKPEANNPSPAKPASGSNSKASSKPSSTSPSKSGGGKDSDSDKDKNSGNDRGSWNPNTDKNGNSDSKNNNERNGNDRNNNDRNNNDNNKDADSGKSNKDNDRNEGDGNDSPNGKNDKDRAADKEDKSNWRDKDTDNGVDGKKNDSDNDKGRSNRLENNKNDDN